MTHRIDYLLLDDIKFHPRNPKAHDVPGIRRSVGMFAFKELPLMDERTGYLAAGHGRIKVLREMHADGNQPPGSIRVDDNGRWLVPVVCGVGFEDDAQLEAYLIASNQTTIAGGWDDEELAGLLQDTQRHSDDLLAATGWDEAGLQELLRDVDPANHIEFPEYDESIADEVEMCECPNCGHKFPK